MTVARMELAESGVNGAALPRYIANLMAVTQSVGTIVFFGLNSYKNIF